MKAELKTIKNKETVYKQENMIQENMRITKEFSTKERRANPQTKDPNLETRSKIE